MLPSRIHQPFIHLITDAERVIFDAKVGNYLEFLFGVHLYILNKQEQSNYYSMYEKMLDQETIKRL